MVEARAHEGDGSGALAALDAALARFARSAPDDGDEPARDLARRLDGEPGVVAFSGGPDSTALLLGLVRRRRATPGGGPPVVAVHVDHAADAGSRQRARQARGLARRLGVPFVEHRLSEEGAGEERAATGLEAVAVEATGFEAAARRRRYRFLARVAADLGAGWIATAHHCDDQAETVLLRLAFGSGLRGLAAIHPARPLPASLVSAAPTDSGNRHAVPPSVPRAVPHDGSRSRRPQPYRLALLRPLLALPRSTLAEAVRSAGLRPVVDPTNADLRIVRNRVRHHLLPHLAGPVTAAGEPPLASRLAALAERARRAVAALDRHLEGLLAPVAIEPSELVNESPAAREDVIRARLAVSRSALASLPAPLLPHALALLHRRAGAPYPAGREARRELVRQLAGGGAVGCDCGGGWRWESRGGSVALVPPAARPARRRATAAGFSYILVPPGEVEIAELGLVLRLYPTPLAPWMYEGAPHRAGLALELSPGEAVTVRNRRPGDRLRPLGTAGRRRLKQVLIDGRVPRARRDRLPLLVDGGGIAWVPGVTVAERCRLPDEPSAAATVWVAELVER